MSAKLNCASCTELHFREAFDTHELRQLFVKW